MKKFTSWLLESNRVKHLGYGAIAGLGANDWYCAEYIAFGVGAALEFKDKQHGDAWDWIDFAMTVFGVNIGFIVRKIFL